MVLIQPDGRECEEIISPATKQGGLSPFFQGKALSISPIIPCVAGFINPFLLNMSFAIRLTVVIRSENFMRFGYLDICFSDKRIPVKLSDYDIECLEKARQLIDQDKRVHHTIEEIAHSVGMGTTRLKEGFKQYYGVGLYGYLLTKRMELAKQLLLERRHTIKYIAHATGFAYTSNFTVAFKKRFGVTPGRFGVHSS